MEHTNPHGAATTPVDLKPAPVADGVASTWSRPRESYYNLGWILCYLIGTVAVILIVFAALGTPTEQIENRLSEKYGVSLKAPKGWADTVGTWTVDGTKRQCFLDKRNLALKCEGQAGNYLELAK